MKKKILIIDEEPHILIMTATRLRANGYEVFTSLSCLQGLEKINSDRPDLILLDCMGAENPGEELMHQLKNDEDLKMIPIIVMSTDINRLRTSEFLLRGAKATLLKPFTPEELLQTIKKILN